MKDYIRYFALRERRAHTRSRILEKKGAYVGAHTVFAAVPVMPHDLCGVFISDKAVIGKDCVIFHQVTIGSNTLPDSKGNGAPVIGDNCYIGCGAKIIGKVKIGDHVRIGANCVVVGDVPDHTVVVMEKPRLIKRERNDNRFLCI